MACQQKVIDVFGSTRGSSDELSVGSVISVEVHEASNATLSRTVALVANWATDWIVGCVAGENIDLQVGDVVRIGDVSTTGYTDYLTVTEKKLITHIGNGIMHSASDSSTHIFSGGSKDIKVHDLTLASTVESNTPDFLVAAAASCKPPLSPLSIYAYRLNFAVNATTPPRQWFDRTKSALVAELGRLTPTPAYGLLGRHAMNPVPFPLYKIIGGSGITIRLDTGVKAINWIKLVGYTLINGGHSGFQSAHEVNTDASTDDWIAMHVREVPGEVHSNEQAANGAFAVLYWGGSRDTSSGAVEYHQYNPDGLAFYECETPLSARTLTIKFTNRTGNAAHYGRIQLWFKVCVRHG